MSDQDKALKRIHDRMLETITKSDIDWVEGFCSAMEDHRQATIPQLRKVIAAAREWEQSESAGRDKLEEGK